MRKLFTAIFLFVATTGTSVAQGDDWLRIETSRMVVLSQASESRTLEWVADFNQFIDSLRVFLPLNEALLPPLTVVMFEGSRGFRDYRPRTASGVARDVVGVFINRDTHSLMSMSSRNRFVDIEELTFHEAVHWFLAADPARHPLWFNEGIAEVFSTYKVDRGTVVFGEAHENSAFYLQREGLYPMDRFLRLSQDAALHGDNRYYPQSWAFVHYMLFGDAGGSPQKLGQLLGRTREAGLSVAVEEVFDMSFEELGEELREYVRRGRYTMIRVPLEQIPAEPLDPVIRPATEAEVLLGLARLALGTSNVELAQTHVDALRALAPQSTTTHELRAELAAAQDDEATLDEALAQAIALGSRDSATWVNHARRLIQRHYRGQSSAPYEAFEPEHAREIADAWIQAIDLYPWRLRNYEEYIQVLLSVREFTIDDEIILDNGSAVFPGEGLFDFGRALIAESRGDAAMAMSLAMSALAPERNFDTDLRRQATFVVESWVFEGTLEDVYAEAREGNYEAALEIIDSAMQDEAISAGLRRTLERARATVLAEQKFYAAQDAIFSGRPEEGRAILETLIDDKDISPPLRAEIRRRLALLDEDLE